MTVTGWTFVVLTSDQYNAIRGAVAPGFDFKETAIKMPNGDYKVPLQVSTVEGIMGKQLANETIGDTILRVCHTAGRPAN